MPVKHPDRPADAVDVTALALDAAPAATRPRVSARALWTGSEHVLVLANVVWMMTGSARDWGGRAPYAVSIGLALGAGALIAIRIWRCLPPTWLAMGAAVSVAALAVCAVTPPGLYQATSAAAYCRAAVTVLLVAAYANTRARRALVAAVVAGGGALQFTFAFTPWWGSDSPATPMIGTFYWHNPYAAFLLAPALIGLALFVERVSWWSGLGLVAAVLSSCGIVFSSSRSTLACLAAGWLLVTGAAVWRGPVRWRIFGRAATALTCTVAAAVALTSSLVFSAAGGSALSATEARGSAQSLGGNGIYRWHIWQETLAVFRAHPLTGAGYGGLNHAQTVAAPGSDHYSSLAHSGYLQALGDGGLLLGVPFLLACLLVVVAAWRRCRWRGELGAASLIALGGLMVHSGVDFDWAYPAAFSLAAAVAGLCLAGGVQDMAGGLGPTGARHRSVLAPIAVGALVAGCVAGAMIATSPPLAINWHPGVLG